MKAVVGRVVVLALVATASASAAQPASNGRILVLEAGDLFSVLPDGSDRLQLTSDGRNSYPEFSPDGTRIAFLKSDGSSPRDVYVMNADGGGGARLIASHPETTNAVGIHGIAWSPDSSRLAYFTGASPAIRVVDARDGTPVALPQAGDPQPFESLEWSPDGSELLYDDGNDIWIKPLDGSGARNLVDFEGVGTHATWSPDGGRIAFVRSGSVASGGVYVIRRDGTDLRHVGLTGRASVGAVRWKPDGTAVVFDATVSEGVGPRNVQLVTSRILLAGAEGAAIRVLRDHVGDPMPSPDNAQILLGRASRAIPPGYESLKPGAYTMNADGSCLTLVTSGRAVGWQAAPRVAINPPRECVDLVVSMTAPGVTGLRGVPYSIVLRNDGTLPARDVRVRISIDAPVRFLIGRATSRYCSVEGAGVTCRIDELERPQRFAAAILARPSRPTPLHATVTVSSAARDSDPASDEATAGTRVRGCWIAGTDFNDRLAGTRARETICGYAGDDTILARDGERDVVDCGRGDDRAIVDRREVVLRGCERISRG